MIQVLRPADVPARLRTTLTLSAARLLRPLVPPEMVERWHRRLVANAGQVRRTGLAVSTLIVGLGASMAWIVPPAGELPPALGVGLFVAGHIGLIAVMTLTSFTFTFVDRRRNLFLVTDSAS